MLDWVEVFKADSRLREVISRDVILKDALALTVVEFALEKADPDDTKDEKEHQDDEDDADHVGD
jgi:hypothetical protein